MDLVDIFWKPHKSILHSNYVETILEHTLRVNMIDRSKKRALRNEL